MARFAEDPLIDRLKELGLDFVADVLDGKRTPTQAQRDVLSQGHVSPRTFGGDYPLIGGMNDGRKISTELRVVEMPVFGEQSLAMPAVQFPRYTTERYRRERLVANQREAVFYTHESLSIEQAVVQLVVGYRCSVLDSQEEQHR